MEPINSTKNKLNILYFCVKRTLHVNFFHQHIILYFCNLPLRSLGISLLTRELAFILTSNSHWMVLTTNKWAILISFAREKNKVINEHYQQD